MGWAAYYRMRKFDVALIWTLPFVNAPKAV
jgi:hypothetical protein